MMSKKYFVWQAEFAFSEDQNKIFLVTTPDLISQSGEFKLFECEEKRIKISAYFSLLKEEKSSFPYQKYCLNKLSLVKKFDEVPNLDVFQKLASDTLLEKLERLKYILGKYSSSPGLGRIIDHEGNVTVMVSAVRIRGANAEFFNPIDLALVRQRIADERSYFDEYIERFNSIMQIKDPLFRLISLVSLMEFIDHTAEEKTFIDKHNPCKVEHLKWAWAARSLIAHGVIHYNKSLEPLKEKLGINVEKIFFDRKNASHFELIEEAVRVYTKSIKYFIDSSWHPRLN